jgi:uroporphyrinogen-III synthase
MMARVIVTRPQREAESWVRQLGNRGLAAQALPLIQIAPIGDAQPAVLAWRQLHSYDAVMFVSGNAVEQFFALKPGDVEWAAPGPGGAPRAWATGPGTRQALQQAGISDASIDAPEAASSQFDSEALWQRVAPALPARARVLIVRGSDATGRSAGRPWLSDQLQAVGATVDLLPVYQRLAPTWSPAEHALAAGALHDGSVWLFSSSEAVLHLCELLPGHAFDAGRAVATHPRIAQAVRDAGFGVVAEARPALDDVIASIESLR